MNNLLKSLLEQHGRNLSAVAKLVGVTPGAVSSWVSGRAKPRLRIARKLKKYCQIPLDVFGYKEEKKETLCIVYVPSCDCNSDQIVTIDRKKMPETFSQPCPECKQIVTMRISEPPIFYCPIQEKYIFTDENGDPIEIEQKTTHA